MANKITKEEAIAELKRREEARKNSSKGFGGVMQDVDESLHSAPQALGEMVASIPGGINNVGNYATHNNPLKTGAQLGAGAGESMAGLLSSPQVLARYLSDKFPGMGKAMERGQFQGKGVNDPTIFEQLMKLEKDNGLEANEEEASVRNAGGLLSGAGALRKIPSMLGRTGTIAAEQGGRGGDPLHAALLSILGETAHKTPWKKGKELPDALMDMMKSIPDKVKSIPELTANIGQSIGEPMSAALKDVSKQGGEMAFQGMEALADKLHKWHVPVIPKKILTKAYEQKYSTIDPQALAREKVFGDISEKDLPQMQERADAGKRLDLSFNTPSELLLSPFHSAREAEIGLTKAGEKRLYEKGAERTTTEGKAIDNLLNTIYDSKELDPKKNAAYEETMKAHVPEDFIQTQMKRPVIKEAVKKLESNSAYRQDLEEELGINLNDVKPTSFMYWDMVKRVLGDMGERTKEKGQPTTESDIIAKTRRSMVKVMDDIKPAYKTARNISERKFTRKKLEKVFDAKDMTLNNFWSFLKSDEKFNNIMQKLEAFPEAQQKLKDIRTLSNDMIPFDDSIRTAYKLKKTGMSKERNKFDALKRALDQQYGELHDVAAVDLMTHPDIMSELRKHLENQKGSNP